VPPLRLRFTTLNHKYLISAFSTGVHPLLSGLNSTKMDWEFGMVDGNDFEPSVRPIYDYPLEELLHVPNVNDVVGQELNSVEKDFHQMVVPRLVASATSGFDSSSIFFTDERAGRVLVLVYTILVVSSPAFVLEDQVFTSEMSAIFMALIQIRARHPGRNLIHELFKGPADSKSCSKDSLVGI
jgi:hypothetical protein